MIRLEVFGEAETMASVAQLLDASEDVTRVRLTDATKPGHAVVVAVVAVVAVLGIAPAPILEEEVGREGRCCGGCSCW